MTISLVTGGAKSGKSSFAESQLNERKNVAYIATGVQETIDLEMEERIRRHQESRNKEWHTEERYLNIAEFIEKNSRKYPNMILDCVTVMTTNLFFHYLKEEQLLSLDFELLNNKQLSDMEEKIFLEWSKILKEIKRTDIDFWIVTNEVGSGVVPISKMGRWFQDLLGKINQKIGKEAENVYFVVCGISQKIK